MTVRETNPRPPFAKKVSQIELTGAPRAGYASRGRRRIDWPRIVLFAVIVALIFVMASVFHK
jgi:hypothetical protein